MELRQLRHFLAVIDQRHFGRAASAVNLTQQALSHSISTLEKSLHVKLLERGAFGAEPTAAGRLFEKRARLILAEAEFATAEMSACQGGTEGQLRIGLSRNFATRLVPQALLLFARARPLVRVATVVGPSDRILGLAVTGQIDFAVTAPLGGVQGYLELEHERLGTSYVHDPNFLIMRAAHPLAGSGPLGLADLGSHPWCMPESFPYLWEKLFRAIQDAGGRPPEYVFKSDSVTFVKSLLLRSDFVAVLGREVVHPELESGTLVARRLPALARPVPGYVSFRRRSALQSAAAAFLPCLDSAMALLEGDDVRLKSAEPS